MFMLKLLFIYLASMLNQRFHHWKCFCKGLSGEVFLFKIKSLQQWNFGKLFLEPDVIWRCCKSFEVGIYTSASANLLPPDQKESKSILSDLLILQIFALSSLIKKKKKRKMLSESLSLKHSSEVRGVFWPRGKFCLGRLWHELHRNVSAAPRSWTEKKTTIKKQISETISRATIQRSPLVINVRCDHKGRDQKDLAGPKCRSGTGEEFLAMLHVSRDCVCFSNCTLSHFSTPLMNECTLGWVGL